MVAVRQQQQGMPGAYRPFCMLLSKVQASLLHDNQIEFAHTAAVRMLVSGEIYGSATL